MEENKENAYLTCGCAGQCYENCRREGLYRIACQTNKPEDWGRVPIVHTLIDCFNLDCLMRKDYKLAMENLKKKKLNKH